MSGEEYTSDFRCQVCPYGYYLLVPPKNETACKKCDPNAECKGGNTIYPKADYYRKNDSDVLTECGKKGVCLPGTDDSTAGRCLYGYQGTLCGDCIDGFSKTGPFKCGQCPNKIRNIVQISLMLAGYVIYVGFCVHSTLAGADKDEPMHSSLIKILTNHM